MSRCCLPYFSVAAVVSSMFVSSFASAQSGAAVPGGATSAAAPGGATPAAAPGGATSSVAPGGTSPATGLGTPTQSAPGSLPGQAAPGNSPPQAAPGSLPQQAAPGGAPGFIPSTGGAAGTGTAPSNNGAGTSSANGSSLGNSGSNPSSFNGTPTTLGLGFASDGNGLRLDGVVNGSFAQQAGMMAGDTVVGVNGQTVNSQAEMQSAMRRAFSANAPLNLSVRRNGQIQSLGIPLPKMDGTGGMSGATSANTNAFRGFSDGVSFSTGVANGGIRSAGGENGLQVSQVSPNSWAADAGLQMSDRIVSADGQPISSDLRLASVLQSALQKNASTQLMVNRNGVLTPLTVNRPAGFMAKGPASAATGNFSTDFGQFAGDFSQAIEQAQKNSTAQFQQLNQFNDRLSSLRGLIMSSTGQSADNVRILEQLRSLRNDLTSFNAQTGGVMQLQIHDFIGRLNQLNPSFENSASGTPANAASASTAAGAGSAANAGATGTANNPANTPAAGTNSAGASKAGVPR